MKLNPRAALPVLLMLLILVGIPMAVLSYQAHRTGMTWSQIVRRAFSRTASGEADEEDATDSAWPKGERIDFLKPRPIGDAFEEPPWISHVAAVDLDQDGMLDVVVCDCRSVRDGFTSTAKRSPSYSRPIRAQTRVLKYGYIVQEYIGRLVRRDRRRHQGSPPESSDRSIESPK